MGTVLVFRDLVWIVNAIMKWAGNNLNTSEIYTDFNIGDGVEFITNVGKGLDVSTLTFDQFNASWVEQHISANYESDTGRFSVMVI